MSGMRSTGGAGLVPGWAGVIGVARTGLAFSAERPDELKTLMATCGEARFGRRAGLSRRA